MDRHCRPAFHLAARPAQKDGHAAPLGRQQQVDGRAEQERRLRYRRLPHLHTGSVPTLRDLLEPASKRPAEFYRGYDVYDQRKVGFASVESEGKRKYFKLDTKVPGNSNQGHEGKVYGTELTSEQKDAL